MIQQEAIREALDAIGQVIERAKLGSGARFKKLSKGLKKKGASDPDALAAWIGRKKHGKKKMAKLSAKGRKKG